MSNKNIKNKIIAIPSTECKLDAQVSDSLGKTPFIIFYNIENNTFDCIENPGFHLQDGSGLKATELIIEKKANVLLTREVGKKAYSILMQNHLDVQLYDMTGSVKSFINKYLKN